MSSPVEQAQVDKVAEAILQAESEMWEGEAHFNLASARVYARAALAALQLTEEARVARYTDGLLGLTVPLDSVTSDAETLLRCYRGSVLERRLVGPWRTA